MRIFKKCLNIILFIQSKNNGKKVLEKYIKFDSFMHKDSYFKSKNFLITTIISFIFAILNIYFLKFGLPWVDEVMNADLPINYILTGRWETTANNLSFDLQQFFWIPCVWLFGISHTSIAGLGVFLAFLSCVILSRYLVENKILTSTLSFIVFVLMFWLMGEMYFMYSNGRYDMLVMLFTILVINELSKYENFSVRNYIILFCLTFLLFWSSVSSLPFLLFGLAILFFFLKEYRLVFLKQGLLMIFASICAWSFLASLHYIFKNLGQFKKLYFNYSATFNHNTAPFYQRLFESYYVNKEAFFIAIINLLLLVYILLTNKNLNNKKILLIYLLYIMIPFAMTVAGRYPIYYSWSFALAGVVFMLYLFDNYLNNWIRSGVLLFCVCIILMGTPKRITSIDWFARKRLSEFIDKQKIKKNECVVSDFVSYFEIRKKTRNCYFPGAHWQKLPNKINYFIVCPNDWGSNEIKKYIQNYKNNGNMLLLQDALIDPLTFVYRVE